MEPLLTVITANHDCSLWLFANAIELQILYFRDYSLWFLDNLALYCDFRALHHWDGSLNWYNNLRLLVCTFSLFLRCFASFTVWQDI